MSARLRALVAHDVRLQFRGGIHAAYAVVVACYVGVLWNVGARLPSWLKVIFLYTDPSVLGFFFLGALMLLERAENTRSALATTPIGPRHYLGAKTISLTAVSLFAAATIAPFAYDGQLDGARVVWLSFVVCATSVHYIGLGVVAALRSATTTGYLLGAALWLTPIVLPAALAFMDPVPSVALLIPAAAHVALLRHGLADTTLSATSLGLGSSVAVLAALFAVWAATRALGRSWGGVPTHASILRASPSRPPALSAPLAPPLAAPSRARAPNGYTALGRFRSVVTHDLRNLARDPTLLLVSLASTLPALAFGLGHEHWDRWGQSMFQVNGLSAALAPVVLVMPAILLGWVLGFLYIEDRDDGPLQALAVSPLGTERYFLYRAVWSGALAWSISVASVRTVLPGLSWVLALVVATLVAGEALLVAVVLAAMGKNKVEGLAITKLTNLAALVPLLAATASPWRWLAGVIPTFWIGELCLRGSADRPVWIAAVLAFGVHGAVGWLFYHARR